MLFPEEIFDLILKQHKKNYIKKILNDVINHRINNQFKTYDFYNFTIKRLWIEVHESKFQPVYTTYFWSRGNGIMDCLN